MWKYFGVRWKPTTSIPHPIATTVIGTERKFKFRGNIVKKIKKIIRKQKFCECQCILHSTNWKKIVVALKKYFFLQQELYERSFRNILPNIRIKIFNWKEKSSQKIEEWQKHIFTWIRRRTTTSGIHLQPFNHFRMRSDFRFR